MHSQIVAVAALFASGALAAQNWVKVENTNIFALRDLRARQAFEPPTSGGFGENCADAFGKGHVLCEPSKICYNPDEGQICCPSGNPCPKDSFCLGDGKNCCPKGISKEECADKLGVPLPSSPAPEPTDAPEPTGSMVTITTTICESSPLPTGGDEPVYPTPTESPVVPAPTGGVPMPTGTDAPPPFTGAASIKGVATGSLAVAALVGLAQNLL